MSQMGPMLLKAALLTKQELDECLEQASKYQLSIWDYIVQEKRISEDSLAEAFAKWLKLPRVRLASASPEPEALKTISDEVARKHICLPFESEAQYQGCVVDAAQFRTSEPR